MTKRALEEAGFAAARDREAYLREHSALPGPRANLGLIDVASAASGRADLVRWAALGPLEAPENTPGVFLACVGIVGLGRLVAAGDRSYLADLRRLSQDPRWRVREAVAMALQAWGDTDPDALVDEMGSWAEGSPLEGRAAMAALCEPRLLRSLRVVAGTLAILGRLTVAVRDAASDDREAARILRQALGYGWSVALAADLPTGLSAFEPWLGDPNPDIRWIVRQNLAKNRLVRAAPDWTARARSRLPT